ncbi:MAG: cytochrome c biogenesis protein CcdC [Pseudomonadota bacterium]
MNQDDLIRYALIGGAITVALLIRLRRIGRWQRLRPGLLWIVPTIFTLLAVSILWQFPPAGFGWLWLFVAFLAGGGLGWQRGRLTDIRRDPDSGDLLQRSSPTALLFLGLLVVVRWAVHGAIGLADARWHLGAMLISDIFIAFATGGLVLYRLELYLRARRLSLGMKRGL